MNDIDKILRDIDAYNSAHPLPREAPREQTKAGRLEELTRYYYRYRDLSLTTEQARAWAEERAKRRARDEGW